MTTRVYLEQGSTSVFAVSLEWPGWCRRARTAEGALEALDDYRGRYAQVVSLTFRPGPLEVVATLRGNATTNFGAPDARGDFDEEPLPARAKERQLRLLEDCWRYFDLVVKGAPAQLRRGPRGGGRDPDKIVEHVRNAERAYAAKSGRRVAPRTPWSDQRLMISSTLRESPSDAAWPVPYAIRRIAWHLTDHAWEIEDKSN